MSAVSRLVDYVAILMWEFAISLIAMKYGNISLLMMEEGGSSRFKEEQAAQF